MRSLATVTRLGQLVISAIRLVVLVNASLMLLEESAINARQALGDSARTDVNVIIIKLKNILLWIKFYK